MSGSPGLRAGDRVFITGATGLVGSHVASLLRQEDAPVRALCRAASDASYLFDLGCQLAEGNVEDPLDTLIERMRGCTVLVHAAALTYASVSWPRIRAVNVEGTRRLLRAAGAVGVRRVVYLSSVAVYGDQTGPLDESADTSLPIRPAQKYARSKREAERVVHRLSDETGMSVAILRSSALYGERDRILTPGLSRILRLPVHPLPGGGRTRLALVYVGNLAHAVLAAARAPLTAGVHVYNVAEDHPLTQRWLYSALASHLGIRFRPIDVPPVLISTLASAGDGVGLAIPGARGLSLRRAARLALSGNPYRSSRIRDELGWSPVVSLDDALRRTASWISGEGVAPARLFAP